MSPDVNQQSQEVAKDLAGDHAEVDELIHSLLTALDGADVALSFERLDLLWARLAVHIRAEHLCLFPSILGAMIKPSYGPAGDVPPPETVRRMLERLRADHDFFMVELATAVNAAREWLSAGVAPTAEQLRELKRRVRILSDRLVEHNRLEEQQVYLWPEALLPAHERTALRASMKREIENLPPRFSARRGGELHPDEADERPP